VLSTLSFNGFAAFLSFGSLTLENENDVYVSDTLNQRQWLRWDQTKHLNSTQLFNEIGDGGSLTGWIFAEQEDAEMFTNAALSDDINMCLNIEITSNFCNFDFDSDRLNAVIGRSGTPGNYGRDNYVYYQSNDLFNELGVIRVRNGGGIYDYILSHRGTNHDFADKFSLDGEFSHHLRGYMLYRDINDVNSPVVFFLMSIGIGAILLLRVRRNLN
jgi:hypothetical protein